MKLKRKNLARLNYTIKKTASYEVTAVSELGGIHNGYRVTIVI
nr:MAG TPA: hypothetical protein [Caudoviricetes sp.]DAM28336.1 MAG TPA: hypothetical protein [Caudoviricetes sp.]DAV28761.1 MAG TPA: hypothetical protein [Caudoviricetes sp.]